jgi:hypothetical protein
MFRHYQDFSRRDCRKPIKTSVRVVGLRAETEPEAFRTRCASANHTTHHWV